MYSFIHGHIHYIFCIYSSQDERLICKGRISTYCIWLCAFTVGCTCCASCRTDDALCNDTQRAWDINENTLQSILIEFFGGSYPLRPKPLWLRQTAAGSSSCPGSSAGFLQPAATATATNTSPSFLCKVEHSPASAAARSSNTCTESTRLYKLPKFGATLVKCGYLASFVETVADIIQQKHNLTTNCPHNQPHIPSLWLTEVNYTTSGELTMNTHVNKEFGWMKVNNKYSFVHKSTNNHRIKCLCNHQFQFQESVFSEKQTHGLHCSSNMVEPGSRNSWDHLRTWCLHV